MAGVQRALENLLRVEASLAENVVAGHEVAGSGVGVAVTEDEVLRILQHFVDGLVSALLVNDEVGVVAVGSVLAHNLGKDLAAGAVNHLDGALVADPREVDLAEAHGLDDTGVVGSEVGPDVKAGLLLHGVDEGIPCLLQVDRGFRGNDAEGHRLGLGSALTADDGSRGQKSGGETLERHEKLLVINGEVTIRLRSDHQ